MMKSVSVGATMAVAAAFLSTVVAAASPVDELKEAVILIERPGAGGLVEKGTGFFITDSGHVLTAAHVLLEPDVDDQTLRGRQIQVTLYGQSDSQAAKVLYVNQLVDVAVLKIRIEQDTPYLPLGTAETVEPNDVLTIVGHPYDGRQWDYWNVSGAMVKSITPLEHIFLHTTVFEGQSGGPVVDQNGYVVGIVAYRREAAQQAYVVPIDDVRWILAGLVASGTGAAAPISETSFVAQPAQKGHMFENSFLRARLASLKNFVPTHGGAHVTVGLDVTNITQSRIGFALARGNNKYYQDARVSDDSGATCVSGEVSGINVVDRTKKVEASSLSLLEPGVPVPVLLLLDNCRGKPTGQKFAFTSEWFADVEGKIEQVTVGFFDIQPDQAEDNASQ